MLAPIPITTLADLALTERHFPEQICGTHLACVTSKPLKLTCRSMRSLVCRGIQYRLRPLARPRRYLLDDRLGGRGVLHTSAHQEMRYDQARMGTGRSEEKRVTPLVLAVSLIVK